MTRQGSIPNLLAVLAFAACSAEQPTAPTPQADLPVAAAEVAGRIAWQANALDDVNAALAASDADLRVAMMEIVTHPASGEFGTTVFASDIGNKQLPFHFAAELMLEPGEVRYAIDEVEGAANGGLTATQTSAAIDAAMATWDAQTCSELGMSRASAPPVDLGLIQQILGFGGSDLHVADVLHAGWLPGAFFDLLAPDGSEFILGATFTLIWVENGEPVDTNGDGKPDAAFREIYYNDEFAWAVTPQTFTSPLIDVETIALHEAGHGLSQGHFGTLFLDGKGTSLRHLHFAPRAVMNAIYWDSLRALLGSDEGGHCSIWGNWPD